MRRGRTREARILAAALVAELGSPIRAADEARFLIRRRRLGGPVGIYLPPPPGANRPGLLLDVLTAGRDREAMFALAIAHHYLGHETMTAYAYTREGALFPLPDEEAEAREFAAVFLRGMAPLKTVVNSYGARVASAR